MIKEIKYNRTKIEIYNKLKELTRDPDDTFDWYYMEEDGKYLISINHNDKTISLLNNFLPGYEDYIVRDSINEFFNLNNYYKISERDLFIL